MTLRDPSDPLALGPLMRATEGSPEVAVGMIDGPVDLDHPALRNARVRAVPSLRAVPPSGAVKHSGEVHRSSQNTACGHGTFVAGMLAARRGSRAPAICPGCELVLRPVFDPRSDGGPATSPRELARAITDTVAAGARVINLSLGLSRASVGVYHVFHEACDLACRRGVILVAAAGNQGALGHNPLLAHRWVLPVVACDPGGRPSTASNLAPSIARRGLMAPAEGVTSTAPGGRYTRLSGTSVAAPWVSGAIALLWSLAPHATAAEVRHAVLAGGGGRRGTLVPPLLDATVAWHRLQPMKTLETTPRPRSA